jgi:hypothetical protein
MDKPTKILLGGIVCAGMIASGQMFYNRSLENKVNQLKAECIAEDMAEREKTPGKGQTVCDAEELEGVVEVKGQGVQAKLVYAYRDLQREKSSSRFFLFAAVVVGVSALPWLWYFLLRRIRELRDVIVGK